MPRAARSARHVDVAEALDFSTRREAVDLPAFTPPANTQCPSPSVALA